MSIDMISLFNIGFTQKTAEEFFKKLKKNKIDCRVDAIGNVILSKPATKGMEKVCPVVLQAHMDMVCEKNSTKQFDFMKDTIQPVLDGEWLTAAGTNIVFFIILFCP